MECFWAIRRNVVDLILSNVVIIGQGGDLIITNVNIVLQRVYLFLCKFYSSCKFAKSKCVPTRQCALINRIFCLKSSNFAVVIIDNVAQCVALLAYLLPVPQAVTRSGKFAGADAFQRRRKVAFFNAIGAAAVGCGHHAE